jgi:hypothetical protein
VLATDLDEGQPRRCLLAPWRRKPAVHARPDGVSDEPAEVVEPLPQQWCDTGDEDARHGGSEEREGASVDPDRHRFKRI